MDVRVHTLLAAASQAAIFRPASQSACMTVIPPAKDTLYPLHTLLDTHIRGGFV